MLLQQQLPLQHKSLPCVTEISCSNYFSNYFEDLGHTFLLDWSQSTAPAPWMAGMSRVGMLPLLKQWSTSGQLLPVSECLGSRVFVHFQVSLPEVLHFGLLPEFSGGALLTNTSVRYVPLSCFQFRVNL